MRVRIMAALVMAALVMPASLALAAPGIRFTVPAESSTVPTNFSRVSVIFSEPVTAQSIVDVLDSSGRRINISDSRLDPADPSNQSIIVDLPELSPGVYSVSWLAISASSGESAEGSFTFTAAATLVPPAATAVPTLAQPESTPSPTLRATSTSAALPTIARPTQQTVTASPTAAATTIPPLPGTSTRAGGPALILVASFLGLLAIGVGRIRSAK